MNRHRAVPKKSPEQYRRTCQLVHLAVAMRLPSVYVETIKGESADVIAAYVRGERQEKGSKWFRRLLQAEYFSQMDNCEEYLSCIAEAINEFLYCVPRDDRAESLPLKYWRRKTLGYIVGSTWLQMSGGRKIRPF